MDKAYLFVMINSIEIFKVSSHIHFVDLKAGHRLYFALDAAENARETHVEDAATRARYKLR